RSTLFPYTTLFRSEPTTAPLELTTTPHLGYGIPEFTVPFSTGTPSVWLIFLISDSVIIGLARTPLLEAEASAPTWGRPPIVVVDTGTSRTLLIASTVGGFSLGSNTAP